MECKFRLALKRIKSCFKPYISCILKSKLYTFAAYLFTITRDTFIGFTALSVLLWLLGNYSPAFYRFLTDWANNPSLSLIEACYIDSPPKLTHGGRILRVPFKVVLKNEVQQKLDLFFLSEESGIGLLDESRPLESNSENQTVVVIRNYTFKSESEKIDLVFEINTKSVLFSAFEKLPTGTSLSPERCPMILITRKI